MHESHPSIDTPERNGKSRRKLILSLAIVSIILIPGGAMAVDNYPYIARNGALLIIVFVVVAIAPMLGISAVLLANRDLGRIRAGIISRAARGLTRLAQILGIFGGVGGTAILLIFMFWLLTFASVSPPKEALISDLNNLFGNAYQYRIRPDSMRGGNGSYAAYAIPPSLCSNENGTFAATVIHPDTIQFAAILSSDSTSTITVKLGPDGQPRQPWIYSGSFLQ